MNTNYLAIVFKQKRKTFTVNFVKKIEGQILYQKIPNRHQKMQTNKITTTSSFFCSRQPFDKTLLLCKFI